MRGYNILWKSVGFFGSLVHLVQGFVKDYGVFEYKIP